MIELAILLISAVFSYLLVKDEEDAWFSWLSLTFLLSIVLYLVIGSILYLER